MRDGLYQRIYDAVGQIPHGAVTSYGRIARIVNCTARQVGYALAATPHGQNIPWHRVINGKGEISARKGDGYSRQREKLLDEGVVFDQHGRVDFERFGWRDDPHLGPHGGAHFGAHDASTTGGE